VILAPLGRSNIPEAERLDVNLLARNITAQGKRADALPNVDAIVLAIVTEAKAGDTVALLSNGSFGDIHRKLAAMLELPSGAKVV
jgi:UDP-N-acetylmuramate: L-alanyl-gamma-D-glutamyl-meso-diaminopimelate ligase